MMVDHSSTEPEAFSPASPIGIRRTEVGRIRRGFVAEEDYDDYDSPNYFMRQRGDIKNITTLEDVREPEAAPPPNYEESDTSFGVDEHGTPHYVTVRAISHPDPSASSKNPHVWQIKGTTITLSALDATVLVKAGILDYRDLRLYDSTTNIDDQGPVDPITGAISAVFGTVGTICLRVADYPLILSTVLNPAPGEKSGEKAVEFVCDAEKGVTGIVGAGLKCPVDVTYNIARGFHNLPKLYGDRMVRNLDPITGARSGMKAAGKQFGLGIWDGVSGLVMQPVKGAQETGALGCVKGVGKGIAGAACKPAAGAFGLTGYAGRGVYEQVQKARKSKTNKSTRAAQIKQGMKEWEATTEEERRRVLQKAKEDLEEFDKVLGAVKLL